VEFVAADQDGALMSDFPPPLPLDPLPVVAVFEPLEVFFLVFATFCLIAAFFAAIHFARSVPPTRRVRRTTHAAEGVDASPEGASASSPFPNLLDD